jgi:hypothetical protein
MTSASPNSGRLFSDTSSGGGFSNNSHTTTEMILPCYQPVTLHHFSRGSLTYDLIKQWSHYFNLTTTTIIMKRTTFLSDDVRVSAVLVGIFHGFWLAHCLQDFTETIRLITEVNMKYEIFFKIKCVQQLFSKIKLQQIKVFWGKK